MLTSAKEKLRHLKQQTQLYAGFGALIAEKIANKEQLLRNSNFRLIHVPEEHGGRRRPLSIVIPAVDRPTRKKVREQGYFTVSHLWGPEEKWKLWTSHCIIGIDGPIVQVKIRPEKANALLHLLQSTPGYWWIDVFCAQSKTPPTIMGDVYRFCRRCYALVDFPTAGFYSIEAIGTRLELLVSVDYLVEVYKERINGKMGSADQTWHESLDDLLAGWHDGDSADIKALADFFSCQWFARVWTLQEYILPHDLTFISEADPVHYYFDRRSLTPIIETLCEIASRPLGLNLSSATDGTYKNSYRSMSSDEHEHMSSTPGLSRCYFDLTRFEAFHLYNLYNSMEAFQCANLMTLRYGSSNLDILIIVLTTIARLPRTCMYTRDYIYGVSGLLDMNIPAADNDEEVWDSFRKIVQKRTPYVKFPETSPLSGATNMQDVYKMFIGVDTSAFMETITSTRIP